MSAGTTTSAKNVWGVDYPYLVSVDSPYDVNYSTSWSSYKSERTFTAREIADKFNAVLGTSLDPETSDPAGWIEIQSRTDGLYVDKVRVGDRTVSGRRIRESILHLRSHAFDVSYKDGVFTFTTYGYGHGVGLSTIGADYYARNEGWDYKQILAHYYPGTEVK